MMKELVLAEFHKEQGAKMIEFTGYNMPVSFNGIKQEHKAVRENVGMFDVSHMGEFIIRGENALELVQKVTSNNAAKLKINQAQYSCFPNEKGTIIDDLLVYRVEENTYMLVVNASNIEKDWAWIEKHNDSGAEMINISDKTSLFAVQGQNATKVLQSLTKIDLENMKYYTFEKGVFAGCDNVLISATGYTGAGGFEIYINNEDAEQVYKAIVETGKEHDLEFIGLGARDTLRLEMGFCLYGNDIDDTTTPLEAGLGWITKLKTEENNFIGKEVLIAQKEAGLTRKLVGFEVIDRGIARQGYDIINAEGSKIGYVTSGTQSPSLEKSIGMGYVTMEYSKKDTEIFIAIRNKSIKAKVSAFPFYKA